MKKLKKTIRRIALILLIIMAAMVPVPVFFQKKEGKFNEEHVIELVEKKEEEQEIKKIKEEDFTS